eukprot:COSAG02_NODE_159_length_32891_cov_17.822518_19_plen_51_part_00
MNELRVTAVRIDCERIGINNAGGSDLRYLRMSYKASRVLARSISKYLSSL